MPKPLPDEAQSDYKAGNYCVIDDRLGIRDEMRYYLEQAALDHPPSLYPSVFYTSAYDEEGPLIALKKKSAEGRDYVLVRKATRAEEDHANGVLPRAKRYKTKDDPYGLTIGQLTRASRVRQIAYMRAWLQSVYEGSAVSGRFDAETVLRTEFGEHFEFSIKQLADELGGIAGEWVRQDRDAVSEGVKDHSSYQPPPNVTSTVTGDAGDREAIVAKLDEVIAALERLRTGHGGIGHNHPPEEIPLDSELQKEGVQAANDLKREFSRAEPNPEVIKQSAGALKRVTEQLKKFVGRSWGQYMDGILKAAGAASFAAAALYFAQLEPSIKNLATAAYLQVTDVLALVKQWLTLR